MCTRNTVSRMSVFAICLFTGWSIVHALDTPPVFPATMPVIAARTTTGPVVCLRGQIAVGSSWDVVKPDLSRVVVYLASDQALDAAPHAEGHATVVQKNKAFSPNFTVIPINTDVEFPNWDCFDHNVFSVSKAAPAFDLDRYPRGQSKTRTFEKVGVVQVFCNIHPQMRAIIFVTPNIYFTRADAQGKFELKNVPPGKCKIVAWQERCGEQSQDVTARLTGTDDIKFTLEENRASIMTNNPPEHEKGYGVERGLGVKRRELDLPVVKESHAALDPEK